MTKLTPLAILAAFWFIGIIFGNPGLWFPIGVVAMVAVALIQKRRGSSEL